MSAKTEKTGRKAKGSKYKDSATGSFLTMRNRKAGRVKSTTVAGKDPMPPRDQISKGSVDSAGRILVPAKMRKALDLGPGDDVKLVLKGDVLEIRSLEDSIRDAQALVKKYTRKRKSVVKELIEERRSEAKRENKK